MGAFSHPLLSFLPPVSSVNEHSLRSAFPSLLFASFIDEAHLSPLRRLRRTRPQRCSHGKLAAVPRARLAHCAWSCCSGCLPRHRHLRPTGAPEADRRVDAARLLRAAYPCEQADIIVVSCGNTFCAIQRWERLGLDVLLRRVAAHCDHRGRVVLAGGSAGAICRFTAGHSRSANPATFRSAMLQAAAAMTTASSAHAASPAKTKGTWSNIHVHGLGILPGLLCPHYSIAQGDRGARRGEDFTELLLRHPTERGVALDQWAMLALPQGRPLRGVPGPWPRTPGRCAWRARWTRVRTPQTSKRLVFPSRASPMMDAFSGAASQSPVTSVICCVRQPGVLTAVLLEAQCAEANPCKLAAGFT